MARLRPIKTNFTNGEVDPLITMRSDLPLYQNGVAKMRNALPFAQGGFARRPGLQYMTGIPAGGQSAPAGQDVVFPMEFAFSAEENYLIVFTIERGYIFRKEDTGSGPNQLVFTLAHSYTSQQILEFTSTQVLDLMLIFHKDKPIQQITRLGETNWNFADFSIKNIPSFAFGEVQEKTLTVPANANTRIGDTLVLVAGVLGDAVFVPGDVGSYIKGFGSGTGEEGDTTSYYKITQYNVSNSVDVEVLDNPIVVSSFTLNAVEWLLEEPDWSATRGYPRCGTFFQGRLCVAGSRDRPGTIWTSRAGDITDFNNGGVADDFGITATADTGTKVTFQSIYPGRHLQVMADTAEFYVPISELDPITPTNFALRRTSSIGSLPAIPLFDVDGVVYFPQRGGGSLRQFVFSDKENAYTADVVSLFSSHLIRGPVDIAIKKSLNTEKGNYIWLVNGNDGSLASFSLLRSELINAWSLQTTLGTFHHVAVLDQTSYFHIKRTIDGQDVDYIEFFNEDLRFDAGVIETNLTSPITVVSGLDHLEGESIGIIVDDVLFANETVVGGSVTLPEEAQNSYQLGIPFPDIEGEEEGVNVLVETLPSDILLKTGTTMGKKKRIVNATVRVVDTQGFYLQGIQMPFRQLPDVLDIPIPLQSGDFELNGLLGWDDFGQIKITQKEPLSMKVLGLAYDLSTGT